MNAYSLSSDAYIMLAYKILEESTRAKQNLIIKKVFQVIKKSIYVLENLICKILMEGGGETTIF